MFGLSRGGCLVGVGNNAQPAPLACAGNDRCREVCGKLCEHAEQVAIRKALTSETNYRAMLVDSLQGFQLVHAKVVDGKLVAGGGPSCWQCSRLVLAVGLDGVWLYEQPVIRDAPSQGFFPRVTEYPDGDPLWRYYTAVDFHRATLTACKIGGPR